MNHDGLLFASPASFHFPVVGTLMPGHRVSRERSLLDEADKRQV